MIFAVNRLALVTLMCVAVMAVPTAWAINCDVVFPPTTFQAPVYDFVEGAMQAWLISPNTATTLTPSGSAPCSSPAYFAQYTVNGAPYVCVTSTTGLIPTDSGCAWNLYQGNGFFSYNFNFNINCDPNANATIVPPAYITSQFTPVGRFGGMTYWGNFTSKLVCGDAPLFRIAKKP